MLVSIFSLTTTLIGFAQANPLFGDTNRDGKLDRSPYHLLLLAENETGYKNLLKI